MNPTPNCRLSCRQVLLTAVAALGLSTAQALPSQSSQGPDDAAPPKAAAASDGDPMPRRLRYGAGYESRFGRRTVEPSTAPGSGAGQPAGPSPPRGHGRGRGR